MCAFVAAVGSPGISRLHVCVDLICFPSGRCMCRGFVVGCMFCTGAPGTMKWPVAPASAIASLVGILMLVVLNIVSAFGLPLLVLLMMTVSMSSSASNML